MSSLVSRIVKFPKKHDWKGYNLLRKTFILSLFTIKPWFTWKKYPKEFYRAMELDYIDMCKDKELMDEVLKIKYNSSGSKILMSIREMINIFNFVKKIKHLPGDMAEVGVYQGGSAMLIAMAKDEKPLHLFDTFEGLPETDSRFDILEKGDMNNTSFETVKKLLEPYRNVFLYKGLFPETSWPVKDKKFSFVHLDTDIYQSTLSGLDFFYPRMVDNGIIITHDYNDTRTPGVKKAFDEFFSDKPERIIEIWDTQAYIVREAGKNKKEAAKRTAPVKEKINSL